jgi:3-deoxy-D-manno-octulosonic-acid transferase
MQRFWESLYSFFVLPILWVLLQTLGLFNAKARRGIRGRTGLFEALARSIAALPPGNRIWFHSSSMGEFEQAKPIIAELKRQMPGARVIVTFFSPSGYEHSRSYQLADIISYLPFDTHRSARRFLDLVRPDAAVMVRYDIWPNHIWELRRRNIPILIANATMRRTTKRRLPIVRTFHRYVYDAINEILTVSPGDVEAFQLFGLRHATLQSIGDTRFDQVSIRSAEATKRNIIPPAVLQGKKVIVVGSSWPEDEAVVLPSLLELQAGMRNLLTIIVPHEPTLRYLEDLEASLPRTTTFVRFSALNEYAGEPFIIVDSVGILLTLYHYAHIAYIGGSFRQGVHNVLEAAVFGIPVLFGPRHRNSHEPLQLLDQGGAFVVNDSQELTRTLHNLLNDETARMTAGERAALFVRAHLGATDRFLTHLEPYLQVDRKQLRPV